MANLDRYKEEYFLRLLYYSDYRDDKETGGTISDFVREISKKVSNSEVSSGRIHIFIIKMKELGVIQFYMTKKHFNSNQLLDHYVVNLSKFEEYIIKNKLFEMDIMIWRKQFSNGVFADALPY